jgi:hypothetical protein
MRYLGIALMLAAIASPAAAQPAPWSPQRATAGWVVTPAFVFGGLYDTNPTLRSGEGSGGELVGLLNPRTEIDFNGRRARFNAGYSGTLERYRELDELTRYEQRGRIEASYQTTPRLAFVTRHQLTLTPTTDQLDIEGLPFIRVGSTMLTSHGGFAFDLTQRMALKSDYSFQWVNFDRDRQGEDFRFLRGGHAHSPSAELDYALTRRLKVGASYVYRYTDIDAGEEVFDTHRAQGLVIFDVNPNTTVQGRAGMDRVALVGTSGDRTGPAYGAGITHRFRQASISGSFERAFAPSFGFGGLTASRYLRASANVPFLQGRAFVNGSVTFRKTDPVIQRDVLVELDSFWTSATVGYSVARWLRMEAFLTTNHQTSSARGEVNRTRVGVQFVTSKPMRIQ